MKSTDMGTLALMKRLMMPVTPDSLEQFGNYRQGIHTLTEQLNNFAGELPVLLQALSENGSASLVADFAKQCLQITQPLFTETWDGLTVSSLSEQDKETLLTLLSQTELPEQILKAASDGTLSVQDAFKLVKDVIAAQKAVAEQQVPKSRKMCLRIPISRLMQRHRPQRRKTQVYQTISFPTRYRQPFFIGYTWKIPCRTVYIGYGRKYR